MRIVLSAAVDDMFSLVEILRFTVVSPGSKMVIPGDNNLQLLTRMENLPRGPEADLNGTISPSDR